MWSLLEIPGRSPKVTTFHIVFQANDEKDDGAQMITAKSAFLAGLTQMRALSDQKKFINIADSR